MKTIAQQLNIKKFPFKIKDSNGNETYFENSEGYWNKREYDSNGKEIYYEDSKGYWSRREYDSNGNLIYFENSLGYIEDNRPKQIVELTMEELTQRLGYEVKIKK